MPPDDCESLNTPGVRHQTYYEGDCFRKGFVTRRELERFRELADRLRQLGVPIRELTDIVTNGEIE